MNISELFIRRPIGTALLAASVLLVGAVAWPLLPVAPLPQVDFPTIQVSASLPGANAETMAATVATPLERQFALIAGLTELTSSSSLGSTSVTLQFDLSRNIDAAATDVLAAINAAGGQLPSNLPAPPTYRKVNPADSPMMIIALSSTTLPLTTVTDYGLNLLAQQLSQIAGVGQVNVNGRTPAVRVQVDPSRIAALNLDLEDVRTQLTAATTSAPKGNFDGPKQSVTVYDNDQLLKAADWNQVIVAYRNGAPVRVSDIGQAVTGAENTKRMSWTYTGAGAASYSASAVPQGSVQVVITKQPGANVINTVAAIRRALPQLRAALPLAIDMEIAQDRTQTIRASVQDVEFTLVLTAVLVVAVIFIFLRSVPATLIPGLTVPLSVLGTAGAMYLMNYSLDNLSLMALTIATGFVVDDAIVVLENIYRHIEDGMSPLDAAIKGAGEIGFTIISISVSLVAVFIPLLLMGGVIGRLFREFAVTVTMAIGISVLISLTVTPMLCSRFLRAARHGASQGRVLEWLERGFDWLQEHYRRALTVVLRHQRITLLTFMVTAVVTVLLYVAMPKGFFPQQDTGLISGVAEAAQDTSFEAMSEHAVKIADIIRRDPAVTSLDFFTGGGSTNTANYFIILKSREAGRKDSATQIINRLRGQVSKLAGVNFYMQANQDINVGGRPSRTQYQYTLSDSDIAELSQWAPRIEAKMRSLPQLTDIASDQQTDAAALTMTIDRDRASSYGISPALIDATINDAIGQRQIAQYFTQVNAYHVVLEVTPELQENPKLLDQIYINSPTLGKQVPLSSFVNIDNSHTTFLSVNHQGQFPAITLSFNLASGAALGDAVKAINATVRTLGVPGTITGTFQGTAKAFQDTLATQPYLIAAALVAVYVVLGLLYESFIHPLTILSTLPSAGAGALLILMAGGFDLSVIALIGIILLIGIVKKNGIMMVDFALTAERSRNLQPEQSIFEACLMRFRPIMMTTMCAILAGLPLMLGTGTGSELRRPLGFSIVGGLVLSQILTLFTTPVVYIYLDRWHRRLLHKDEPLPVEQSAH